jgi:hypothetical protein
MTFQKAPAVRYIKRDRTDRDYHNKPRVWTEINQEEHDTMVEQAGHKTCKGCKTTNPATEEHFYKLTSSPDGLHGYCIPCCKVSRSLEGVRKRDKSSKISVRQRVRAQSLNIEYEKVELVEVYRIHRGICALCLGWVQPKHASMDHRIPLSRGGKHLYTNVQLTHFTCNQRKSNKIL